MAEEARTHQGGVKSYTVTGIDQNSAQLIIVIEDRAGVTMPFVVNSAPKDGNGHEPQVFAACASLCVSAFVHGFEVQVSYLERDGSNWIVALGTTP